MRDLVSCLPIGAGVSHVQRNIFRDFAFAVWDSKEQKLFCARDALGIKPLHYARVGQVLCIASEAQQILQHLGHPIQVGRRRRWPTTLSILL